MPATRPPGPAPRHNLPAQRTSFVGRERERADLARALAAEPLVTLTGAGGCGKTRLALAVAADLSATFPDGAWLVELAPIAEPALLPSAVAAALGLREAGGGDPLAGLLEFLRPRALLLILDNCEHLVDA
ncbi:MAG TPA: AAA family ATPase, partial [Thermomicrobiales bacterium]|nr:AAA family ATPase [Thermomicrobiales bacterium]